MGTDDPLVLAGSGNPELAPALGRALERAMGVSLGAVALSRFPDGERHVALREPARGRAAYLVQSTGAPVGEALLELVLLADACRRAGARRVVAILPYVGFARQDRRRSEGEALGLAAVARVLDAGSFDRIVALDLHAPAAEGIFGAPVEHLTAVPILAEAARRARSGDDVVVAPDLGAAKMARLYARILGAPLAMVHKVRRSASEVEAIEVVGDVVGRRPVVVDDMISTGATAVAALREVMDRGAAHGAIVLASHLVPEAGGAARLAELPVDRIVVTDSLPSERTWAMRVERVSVAPLLAEAIERLHRDRSLSDLLGTR